MRNRPWCVRWTAAVSGAVAAVAMAAGGAAESVAAESSEKLVVDQGTRVLVTRVRDFYDGRVHAQGSGEIVERVVLEQLQRAGLQPIQGEHAAQLNVQEDVRRERVPYVIRPAIERLRVSLGRDAELTIAIDALGPEVGDPLARCEAEHEVDDDEIEARQEPSEAEDGEGDRGIAPEVIARRLVQPAVEACLKDLLDVREAPAPGAGEEPPGGAAGVPGLEAVRAPRYRLAALDAAWLFTVAGRRGYPPAFWEGSAADLLRPMLVRSDVRLCGGEEAAADEECTTELAVGIGILRQALEPPPPASPVHVVAVVLDAASGEPLRAALAQAPRSLWMQADSTTLNAMLQRAAERALRDRVERFGPAPSETVEVAGLELPRWEDPAAAAGRLLWRDRAEAGVARVGVVVGADGRVSGVEVREAAGLDAAALKRRARSWRFAPARRDGQAVPLYVTVAVAP